MTELYRQGDVLLRRTSATPLGAEAISDRHVSIVQPRNGRLVVAEGEATGHTHGFDVDEGGPEITFYTTRGFSSRNGSTETTYIDISGGTATLSHDEHDSIELPEGQYEVVFQREHDPRIGSQRVYD